MSQKVRLKNSRGVKFAERGGRQGIGLPLLYNDQEIPHPQRHEHDDRIDVMPHLTGKLFSQGYDTKHCLPS
jgi:hypothetical protein